MSNEPEWGYWLDQPGGTTTPPFTVTRPDGKVLHVVERQP